MKMRSLSVRAAALTAVYCLIALSQPASAQSSTDQIIVGLVEPAGAFSDANLDELSAAAGVRLRRLRQMSGNAVVLRLPDSMSEAAASDLARRVTRSTLVRYAEPDRILQTFAVPVDPRYNEQWHYYEATAGINAPAAWDATTGATGIFVAVIDTGIIDHAELAGRWTGGYDFISQAFNARDGDGRDSDPHDAGDWTTGRASSWHGSHVAGTIAAASNNALGVAGINWVSKVVPVRVLGRQGGYTSDIADAIRWSAGRSVPGAPVNPNVSRVINMSLGGSGACSTTFQAAINDAVGAGTVVVVAAGNSGADAGGFQPANCAGVITVAAVNRSANRANYSNFGASVEVAAPGGETSLPANGVLSTLNAGQRRPMASPGGDTYGFYQGTSMASPHVAGVVSLMLSVNPTLTPTQVTDILKATARAFPGGSSCNAICGAGMLDGAAAVQSALTAP